MDRSIGQTQKWNSTRANDRFCVWAMLDKSINLWRTGQVAAQVRELGVLVEKTVQHEPAVSLGSQEDKQCPGLPEKQSEN